MARDLLSDESSDGNDGIALLQHGDLKINEEFARRFEHNKKREEKQRLEEKLGQSSRKRKREGADKDSIGSASDESSSESEDGGELATEALDSEIIATIKAIRSKDPRVYDQNATFYTTLDNQSADKGQKSKKEKPMRLQDYHRINLLNGINGSDVEVEDAPMSYNQEQEQLKKSIIGEILAAEDNDEDEEEGDSGQEFLTAKPKVHEKPEPIVLDVENADKDPETFLSNFMASRAWATSDSKFQPFESDDEEEDRRAEEYEEAYNFRFEDPEKSNEKLRSHARDVVAKYSVRRDEENPRQKKRQAEKEKKAAAKQQLQEEKARLRKLRVEEVEEKVRRIKRAAGLKSKDIQPQDWSRFVDEDWDDAQWEEEMQKRFGEEYYADEEALSDAEGAGETKKRKLRKPKFEDDIDIKDIVPDFDEADKAEFNLTDEEVVTDDNAKITSKTSTKQLKEERKREARRERRIIEQLVDDQLQMELDRSIPNPSRGAGFRYRETSPKSFGLTARDILLAEDTQLNEFAGLKKLAAFRDPAKKQKDQKHLGKRARLRKWRKDTFGNEEGVQGSELIPSQPMGNGEAVNGDAEEGGVDIRTTGKKKRRRNKRSKTEASNI